MQVGPTIADGLAGNMDPDNLAFPVVQALGTKMVIVGEGELRAAVRGLVRHEHLVAEGAGANIDLDLLTQILQEGEQEPLRG